MVPPVKRNYSSKQRNASASATKTRVLEASRKLFSSRGIDAVTISEIGAEAGVAGSTVYALYKSKEGILRELMRESLFGDRFRQASVLLSETDDPVELIRKTSHVSRAIYESETTDLGLIRHASGFSPALRKLEEEFDQLRFDMQAARITALFNAGKARDSLAIAEARRIMWMYTSRDVYRMLVHEGGWSPEQYEDWLSRVLLSELTNTS
jgi:AcrR family transcriptional regulator